MRKIALLFVGVALICAAVLPAGAAKSTYAFAAIASSQYGSSAPTLPTPPDPVPPLPIGLPGGACSSEVTGLLGIVLGLLPGGPPPLPVLPTLCTPAIGVAALGKGSSWSVTQATGAPDTYPACGDIGTAWAPRTASEDPEQLIALFRPTVGAKRVNIYETNIGGFVTKVRVILKNGVALTVFNGPDTTPCAGILSVPFKSSLPVVAVIIDTAAPGWEEIDAVALVS